MIKKCVTERHFQSLQLSPSLGAFTGTAVPALLAQPWLWLLAWWVLLIRFPEGQGKPDWRMDGLLQECANEICWWEEVQVWLWRGEWESQLEITLGNRNYMKWSRTTGSDSLDLPVSQLERAALDLVGQIFPEEEGESWPWGGLHRAGFLGWPQAWRLHRVRGRQQPCV